MKALMIDDIWPQRKELHFSQKSYGSGHEIAAVLLPGLTINW